MADGIDRKELLRRVSRRTGWDEATATEIVEAVIEEISEALKRGESVTLRDFGSFHVRAKGEAWVFKFNPSQRLRAVLGWSSTYRGEV